MVKTPPNVCPGHDTKQSDGEVPVELASVVRIESCNFEESGVNPLSPVLKGEHDSSLIHRLLYLSQLNKKGSPYPNPNPFAHFFAQSTGAVEYTDCISAERYDLPTTSVPDMTLNNLELWTM